MRSLKNKTKCLLITKNVLYYTMENKKEIPDFLNKKANDLFDEINGLHYIDDKVYRIALFLDAMYNEAYEQGMWDGKAQA